MSTIKSFSLPDLGEGLTEADLLTWLVAVGDTVELNQNIAEVETAKAAVELPSPFAGIVAALHVSAGDTVEVGVPIIDIDIDIDIDTDIDTGTQTATPTDTGELVPAAAQAPSPIVADDTDDTEERVPVLVGYGVAQDVVSRRRGRVVPDTEPDPRRGNGVPEPPERPLAPPPVRRLARDGGVDLGSVPATGTHGEVTRADLERHAAADAQANPATPETQATGEPYEARSAAESRVTQSIGESRGAETREAVRGVRKHTADAMVRSAFTAPHVTEFVTVDVTAGLELLDSLRASSHFADVRLTPLALVAKALLVALKSNPSLNSTWDDATREIVTKHYVNLGIAAATPRGLMVPNIKNAHLMSLADLAGELAELTRTAKDGKSSPADLADGTITITNVGVFGVDAGTPILNPGEAAILCFGAIVRRPWEYRGEIALRSVTTLSLSFDHRIVDGQQGSQFLSLIGRILSDPLNLIALS